VTNLEGEAAKIYDGFYVQRGESSEGRIKELKLGIKAARLSCHQFIVNQFRLFLSQAAYILMLEIRQAAKRTFEKGHRWCDVLMPIVVTSDESYQYK
jgi:hypothetical protein